MDHTDDLYYSQYASSTPPPRNTPRSSRPFIMAMIGLAVILGFSVGLYSAAQIAGANKPPALYDEGMVTSLFEKASPAVVEITVTRNVGLQSSRTGTGSGFLVDSEGYILTNQHVIDQADEIQVKLSDGRTLTATILGTSRADDLALIQVDAEDVERIEPLQLADSDQVKPGQLALAIGSPFRNFNSVTVGVISGTGRGASTSLLRPIPDMIQTDAPLNPGNSGGPLLNSSGEVIGVNSAVRTGSLQGLGDYRIGFAVPSNTVKHLLPDLMVSREVRRPWLGVSGQPITRQIARSLGIEQGILVTRVLNSSPAEDAGLVPATSSGAPRDVITAVDGKAVASVEDMVSHFNTLRPGSTVTLSVYRNGRTVDVEVKLAEWPDT